MTYSDNPCRTIGCEAQATAKVYGPHNTYTERCYEHGLSFQKGHILGSTHIVVDSQVTEVANA